MKSLPTRLLEMSYQVGDIYYEAAARIMELEEVYDLMASTIERCKDGRA